MKNRIIVWDEKTKNKLILVLEKDGSVKWLSTHTDIRKWPDKFKHKYAQLILFNAKRFTSKKEKLKAFFLARGVKQNKRLYQELFLGLKLNLDEESINYIKETAKMCSEYYFEDFSDIVSDLLPEKIVEIA